MSGRFVYVTDEAAHTLEEVGKEMLRSGDYRATLLLAVGLAWRYAPPEQHSVKVRDERTGLRLLDGGAA